MRNWNLSSSKDGWSISFYEAPLWAAVVNWSYERLMDLLDHPCCYYRTCEHEPKPCFRENDPEHHRTVWGWLIDRLPERPVWVREKGTDWEHETNPQEFAEYLQYAWFLNNPLSHIEWSKRTADYSAPIDVELARKISPSFVRDMEALDADDDEGE